MSDAEETPVNLKLMPYPVKAGCAKYIKDAGDIIYNNMREIAEIDKYIAEAQKDRQHLVEQVIQAKRKIQNYLNSKDTQKILDNWI